MLPSSLAWKLQRRLVVKEMLQCIRWDTTQRSKLYFLVQICESSLLFLSSIKSVIEKSQQKCLVFVQIFGFSAVTENNDMMLAPFTSCSLIQMCRIYHQCFQLYRQHLDVQKVDFHSAKTIKVFKNLLNMYPF